jgi:hypothetical protein
LPAGARGTRSCHSEEVAAATDEESAFALRKHRGCVPSAPMGRPSKAQASGLGQEVHPISGSQALKGRDKDHGPSLGDRPRASPSSGALSGLPARREGVLRTPAVVPRSRDKVVRPFGTRFDIGSADAPGAQQKMWDTLSPWGRGFTELMTTRVPSAPFLEL